MKIYSHKLIYSYAVISITSILLGFMIGPRIEGGIKAVVISLLFLGLFYGIYRLVRVKNILQPEDSTSKYNQMVKMVEDLQESIQKLQQGVTEDLNTVQQLDQEIKQLETKKEESSHQLSNIITSLKQRPVDEAATFLKNL